MNIGVRTSDLGLQKLEIGREAWTFNRKVILWLTPPHRSPKFYVCCPTLRSAGRHPGLGYNSAMSTEAVAAGMVPDELKHEPRSKGLNTPRKKKPKELAVITECCTGCAGSPACVEYCPVEDCMFWVPDEVHPPFGRILVYRMRFIGCKKCISKGPD